jgi:thiol-disulfide isomerase/thioredoxin
MPARRSLVVFLSSTLAIFLTCLAPGACAASAAKQGKAASESCFVRGRLLGCDGRPMRAAYLKPNEAEKPIRVAKDGSFSLAFGHPGGYLVQAGGVHHCALTVPLLLERPGTLRLDIRLSAVEYVPRIDSVRVVGDFNGWADSRAVLMTREPDGTSVAAVSCTTTEVAYKLLGVARDGTRLCGTDADTCLITDWGEFYTGVRRGPGLVRIVFDPRLLPRSDSPPRFSSGDPGGTAAGIAAAAAGLDGLQERFLSAMHAAGDHPDSAHWDWAQHLKPMKAGIAAERNPLLRSWRMMAYLHPPGVEMDSVIARRVLAEVPPDSPLWSLERYGPEYLLEQITEISREPARARAYEERMVDAHPDTAVRVAALAHLIGRTQNTGDTTGYGRYYARLMREFPGSRKTDQVRKIYAPDRAIQKGKMIPAFSFVDLEDTSRVYRPSDFDGKYLLIDFWATWCGPCKGEMKGLHEAYAKYHDRGLELLSVSFDQDREAVARFRRGKWPMPWLHAYEEGGFDGASAKQFEIAGIPRPILVGPDGRILALEGELRGEHLDRTLAALLPARGEVVR